LKTDDRKIPYKIIILGLIVSLGIILQRFGWFDWRIFLEWGKIHAHSWWLALVIIAIKTALYTVALPGSMMIWMAGLFFNPFAATMVIVAGGVCGAAAAYGFSRRMSADSTERLVSSRFFSVLRNHTDLATLCAVRLLPNFPHSVINYGSGVLRVPLSRVLVSALIGFTAKGYLYASMIRNAATAESLIEVFDLKTVGPLLILVALFLMGKLILRYLRTIEQG
jgi:uncharacterized membrane protein YdjX (TVP38/TMEM64 family)